MSQQHSLLQETKHISNIYMHNITQSLHLKLPTSFLCIVPFCIFVDRTQCLGEKHRRQFQSKE
jgi:hypothetical protein